MLVLASLMCGLCVFWRKKLVAILAGDHLQLPPTVISDDACHRGLGRTLFERLQRMHSCASVMLTVQYRMNGDIMQWSSDELYEGRLTAHDSVASHTLGDLGPAGSDAAASSSISSSGSRKSKGSKGSKAVAAPLQSAAAAAAAAAGVKELPVLMLIDTTGCGFDEKAEEEGASTSNPGEAQVRDTGRAPCLLAQLLLLLLIYYASAFH